MKMKRIRAANMKDALELARRELGDDSVLIDTQKTTGGVIVTFAVEQDDEPLFDDIAAEQIVPFSPAIDKPAVSRVELGHPALNLLQDALQYHNITGALAERIMTHCQRVTLKPDSLIDVAEYALAQSLTANVRFNPITIPSNTLPKRAIMLLGPHGAGKTSTIAKIATQLTLLKKPVHLVSTDTERLGGIESLQILAKMLKCPFSVVETRNNLKALVAEAPAKAWTLIDSAGANIYEFAPLKALGEFATLKDVEPILTMPAGMDSAEAVELTSVFNFIPIERMILTRLDAVRRLGSVFAALGSSGHALANYSNSATPTEACHAFSAHSLASLMMRHARERLTHEPKRSYS